MVDGACREAGRQAGWDYIIFAPSRFPAVRDSNQGESPATVMRVRLAESPLRV